MITQGSGGCDRYKSQPPLSFAGKIVQNNVAQKLVYSIVRTHILHISNVNKWSKKLK